MPADFDILSTSTISSYSSFSLTATTTCAYYNPLHWDKTGGVGSLIPPDDTDANGVALVMGSSTCATEYTFLSPSSTQTTSQGNLQVIVILLIVIAVITLFDFMRRLFSKTGI